MAHQGRKLPDHVIARFRRLCAVCRLSHRTACREAGISTSTGWRYREKIPAKST